MYCNITSLKLRNIHIINYNFEQLGVQTQFVSLIHEKLLCLTAKYQTTTGSW